MWHFKSASAVTAGCNLEWGRIIENGRHNPSGGVLVDWPQEILKIGTLEIFYNLVIKFSCSSGNCGEKWGDGPSPAPQALQSLQCPEYFRNQKLF